MNLERVVTDLPHDHNKLGKNESEPSSGVTTFKLECWREI